MGNIDMYQSISESINNIQYTKDASFKYIV